MSHVPRFQSRREFLARAGGGLGALALAYLLGEGDATASAATVSDPLAPRPAHVPPRARSVIWLFMEGGPSHLALFDPKPELERLAGQPLPPSFGRPITAMGTSNNALMPSKRSFSRHGASGIPVSDWYPNIARFVDDMAVVRSCWADGLNHVGSVCQMNTGSILAGRPSLGAWVTYGLGAANENLPAFVVLLDEKSPIGGSRNWGTGFLPATYQGTQFRPEGAPILNLAPPETMSDAQQQEKLAYLTALDRHHAATRADDAELEARIQAYELAFRMQAHAPEAVDLSREPEATRSLYGLDDPLTERFGRNCLLARRLVERGVRFVQLYCGTGSQWDAHTDLEGNHQKMCAISDRPIAGLLTDLKARGLLEQTLVVWGGEFGRTPMSEKGKGRDHNPYGFTVWLAGGGVRGGRIIGATDELGLRAVENRVHVHDLHATMLHLMGLDHLRLTYRHNGRDERPTVNGGRVVTELIRS
jgi:hypothetical protein